MRSLPKHALTAFFDVVDEKRGAMTQAAYSVDRLGAHPSSYSRARSGQTQNPNDVVIAACVADPDLLFVLAALLRAEQRQEAALVT